MADYPGVPDYRGRLGAACSNLGRTYRYADDQRAIGLLEEAVREERKALEIVPDNGMFQGFLVNQFNDLTLILGRIGAYERVVRLVEEYAAMPFGRHTPRRHAARLLFRCATLVAHDEHRPADERRALASLHEERAFALLAASIDQGFTDAGWLSHEWFDAVRDRPEFESLVRRIASR